MMVLYVPLQKSDGTSTVYILKTTVTQGKHSVLPSKSQEDTNARFKSYHVIPALTNRKGENSDPL